MNDKNVRPRGVIALMLGIVLSVGFVSTSAFARPAPVTKITFKLNDHHVPPGAAATSNILVRTRSNHEWVPFAGAPLSVRVNGTEVLTLVTGADGHATVSYMAPVGGAHVGSILRKLGVTNRTQAAMMACSWAWGVQPEPDQRRANRRH